jgi:trans-aconitate 2-methyltransferase
LELLAEPGWALDLWETTYLHVLPGEDAVFSWMSGTGARPVLQALPDDLRVEFVAEYQAELRTSYPRWEFGTVLPFPRVFAVATRA